MVAFKMRDSVPSARYSPVCNVLHLWRIWLIPTYRVYRLYDTWVDNARKCSDFCSMTNRYNLVCRNNDQHSFMLSWLHLCVARWTSLTVVDACRTKLLYECLNICVYIIIYKPICGSHRSHGSFRTRT